MIIDFSDYDKFMAIRRRLGVRLYVNPIADGWRCVFRDGSLILQLIVPTGSANATKLATDVLTPGHDSAVIQAALSRVKTHDWSIPAQWLGRSLPPGHADKPPSTFVTDVDAGQWIAAGDARGRIKAIDQVALPYDANDANTYWVPRSTFILYCGATEEMLIIESRVSASASASLASGHLDFQFYTWVDPTNGYAPCPPETANAILVAPPAGLWRYTTISDLEDLATRITPDPFVRAAEVASGNRNSMTFSYLEQLADDSAREAVVDGRFGQFVEMKLANHAPVENAAHAVAYFRLLKRTIF